MEATWEPRADLSSFKEQLALVDDWKASDGALTFPAFAKQHNGFGKQMITASATKSCMFEAFKLAVDLLGAPDCVQDAWIDEFMERGVTKLKTDVSNGAPVNVLRGFARFLCFEKKAAIAFNVFDKNWHSNGARRVRALVKMVLRDGIYLVGAVSPRFVGHCFVVAVSRGRKYAIEDDVAIPLKIYGEWIDEICFVRKVELK
ncbi:hypothetical protein ATCC90586_001836 [Pythium insidiosum]|nr:hypothetical protein ATCC90586_001836 [Pythium insidiosum]